MSKPHEIGAVLTLRDNMSATLRGVRQEQASFRNDVKSTRRELDKAFNKRLDTTAATQSIKQLRTAMEPLRKKIVTAVAIKDNATRDVLRIRNEVNSLGRRAIAPVVKAKDAASSVISSIGSKLAALKAAAAVPLMIGIGGGALALKSGATLEQQQISMKHFIGVNNQGKSDSEILNMRDSFIKDLRENANATPFTTSDVIGAGARAVNIMTGDTNGAMGLVKLSEDMAALNPGKTIGDAMEALADAKNGEFERMKEFGFKISADEFKGYVGKSGSDTLTADETNKAYQMLMDKKLNPFFKGGASEQANTATGLVSTIKGKLGTRAQDLGLNIIERIKPQLQGFIKLLDSPQFNTFSKRITDGIGFVFDKAAQFTGWLTQNGPQIKGIIGNVSDWIGEKFGWIGEKTGFLKEVFTTAWSGIQTLMQALEPIVMPILNIIADGARAVFDAFQIAFPYVRDIVTTVWDAISPLLTKLGDALGWVADHVGNLASWLDKKVGGKKSSDDSGVDGSHANGLNYVPFDGYIAELHKGERVQRANENPYNSGSFRRAQSKGGSIVIGNLANTLVVREEADIDKIASKLAIKLGEVAANM